MLQWSESDPEANYRRLGGTLAFCDLSGFTAMSEKLASLGRLGAEELADVLNLLFAALLDDAAAFGGGLLKYGGDAVLLFFEGDDHAARAAAATHRMRATLRRIGTVKTSRGTVRVRMSVGVHSGEFDFFLVGDSHRELLVTGVGTTTTCDMESAADAGQILISSSTAALLAPSCVGAAKGDGFLLRRAPRTPTRLAGEWGAIPEVDPLRFIPVGMHRHIGAVGADAEHRHVAVGFIAFGGVDDLLNARGGDHTAAVLHAFISACQAAFDRYQVCFLYADIYGNGGKVFFTAGAPVSHEDNEERVVRAALDINAGRHDGLHLHTGLNRGYVFAGDVGAEFRRTYTIIGDAVNTAARVMASCNVDGQIRAMPEVLELASSRFELEPQLPFAAKGKALPLTTMAVGNALGPRLADAPLTLVGRDVVLDELISMSGPDTETAIVHVVGGVGMGKTRLLTELATTAPSSTQIALTVAERFGRNSIYAVLNDLLQQILGDSRVSDGEVAAAATRLAPERRGLLPLLGAVLRREFEPTPESRSFDGDEMPTALAQYVAALVAGWLGPGRRLLWLIDNAQFVDEASGRVIAFIAADDGPHLMTAVLAHRPDVDCPVAEIPGQTVEIGPLDEADAVRLARAADVTLLPSVAAALARRCDGNPLFLRELVASARDDQLPDSLETAVSTRIDELAPRDRDALRTASVLGGRFATAHLRALLHGERVDAAKLRDFLTPTEDGFAFRQAVYREVAYEGLTFRRRQRLHLEAGRILEAEPGGGEAAARLSLHFHRAGAWDESFRYSRHAAREAESTSAKLVAATFWQRCSEAGQHLAQIEDASMLEAAANHGRLLYHAGRVDDALKALRAGKRYANSGRERALLTMHMATALANSGNERRVLRLVKEGIALLNADASADTTRLPDADTAVRLLATGASTHLQFGRVADAITALDDAKRLAESAGDPALSGLVGGLAMMAELTTGNIVGAISACRYAISECRKLPRFAGNVATLSSNLGTLLQISGDFHGAEESLLDACGTHTRRGNDSLAAVAHANLAEVYIDQGRWDDAFAVLDNAEPVLRQTDIDAAAIAAAVRTKLVVRVGRQTGPLPVLVGSYGVEGIAAAAELELALTTGDFTSAVRLAETAAAEGSDVAQLEALTIVARAAREADRQSLLLAAPELSANGDPFGALLLRAAAGLILVEDEDAQRLGVVATPAWTHVVAASFNNVLA